MNVIDLGSTVRDKITGFKGIVTSRAVHMNGCDRYWVQPPVDKTGKTVDGAWFDVVTLETLKVPKIIIEEQNLTKKPGGFPSRQK